MSASPALQTAEGRLHNLLLEHRGTPIFERVKLYVAKFAGGRKLSEYLADAAEKEEDKLRVVSTLVAILSAQDFSRLPELPVMENGNAPLTAREAPVDRLIAERQAMIDANEARISEPPEDDTTPLTADEIRAIARKEARAELADVLERVAKVLRETS